MDALSGDDSELYYEHSGRPGLAAPLVILVGLPLVIALSAVYSYILVYCPLVGWPNILFLFGFVFCCGLVLGTMAKGAKCRSPGLLALLGLLAGLCALYFAWVFFIRALLGADVGLVDLTLQPQTVWRRAVAINAAGWWGPSGWIQWALVAVEALVIVFGITLMTSDSISREVFCEDCGTWCEPFETIYLKPSEETNLEAPEDLDPLALLALEQVEEKETPRINAEVLQCTGCELTQAIRFKIVTEEMEDGELEESEEDLDGILLQKKRSAN